MSSTRRLLSFLYPVQKPLDHGSSGPGPNETTHDQTDEQSLLDGVERLVVTPPPNGRTKRDASEASLTPPKNPAAGKRAALEAWRAEKLEFPVHDSAIPELSPEAQAYLDEESRVNYWKGRQQEWDIQEGRRMQPAPPRPIVPVNRYGMRPYSPGRPKPYDQVCMTLPIPRTIYPVLYWYYNDYLCAFELRIKGVFSTLERAENVALALIAENVKQGWRAELRFDIKGDAGFSTTPKDRDFSCEPERDDEWKVIVVKIVQTAYTG